MTGETRVGPSDVLRSLRGFIRHWNSISKLSAPSRFYSDELAEERAAYEHHMRNARRSFSDYPFIGEALIVEVGRGEADARAVRWLEKRQSDSLAKSIADDRAGRRCMAQFHRCSSVAFGRILAEYTDVATDVSTRDAVLAWYMRSTGDGVTKGVFNVQYKARTYRATLGLPRLHEVTRLVTVPGIPYQRKLELVGPLRTGPSCEFVGRLHRKVGARPQQFGFMQPHIATYLGEHHPEFLRQYGGVGKLMVHGGWDTNRSHLQSMADTTHSRGTYHQLLRAVSRAADLNLRKCPLPTGADMDGVHINDVAEPGWESRTFGSTRARVAATTLDAARTVYDRIAEQGGYATAVYLVGGRERRCDVGLGEELKSRAILMPETLDMLIASLPAQQLTAMLSATNSELVIGQQIGAAGQRDRLRLVGDWPNGASRSLDFSGYDGRLTERLIVASFGVLASAFSGDAARVNRVLGWICSTFIDKHVVVPGGFVYRLKQGTPSGHPWTTLINSVANWLIQVSVHDRLGIPQDAYYCEISGDDVRLHYREWTQMPRLDDYVSACLGMWGMVVKPGSVTTGYIFSPHVMCAPDFLATRWPCGIPTRDRVRLLDVSLLPAKPKAELAYQFMRIRYMETNFPLDAETWSYHWAYFDWVNQQMPEETRMSAAALRGCEERAVIAAMLHSTEFAPRQTVPLPSKQRKGKLVRELPRNHLRAVATGVNLMRDITVRDRNPLLSSLRCIVGRACPELVDPPPDPDYFGAGRGRPIPAAEVVRQGGRFLRPRPLHPGRPSGRGRARFSRQPPQRDRHHPP